MKLLAVIFIFSEVKILLSTSTIDTDDFKTLLLNNDVIVDKTFILDEIIKWEDSRLIPVILRPKGWGKSTNLNMIRRFFEIEVDHNGDRLLKQQTINDKLFFGGDITTELNERKKLKRLQVSDFAIRHLGQFPVILLKLKNAIGNTYAETEKQIKSCVTEAFRDHSYLLNSSSTTTKEKLQKYISGEFGAIDLASSLLFLSEKLYEHFGRKIHIFIDDYDVPIINAYVKFGKNLREFDRVNKLLINIYAKTLKDNPHRSIGLITGTLKISLTDSLGSGLPNVVVYTLSRSKFSKIFGFTLDEVKKLFTQASIESDFVGLKHWYNGYDYNDVIYYNAWSTMRCLVNNGTFDYYGLDSVNSELMDEILLSDRMQETIHQLISGQSINFPNLHARFEPINWNKIDGLEILFLNGYLSPEVSSFGVSSKVSIPNKDIKYIYESKVLRWVTNKLNVNESEFRSLAGLLALGKIEKFQEIFQKHLSNAIHSLEKIFYVGLTIALKNALSSTYTQQELLKQKNEDDWTDIFLIPKLNHNEISLLLNYKIAKSDDLSIAAETLAKETDTRRNKNNLKIPPYVRKIIKIGMTFCGEKVSVKHITEEL